MNQLASLQKGLIFHAPLSEWNPTRDEISGAVGTPTDVYNVLDRQGNGRRSYSFNGTSDYVALPTIPAFGTGDFSIIIKAKLTKYQGVAGVFITSNSGGLDIAIDASGYVYLFKGGTGILISGSNIFPLNTELVITYIKSGSDGKLTYNGVTTTLVDNYNYNATESTLGNSFGYSIDGGSISLCRIFNYALTPTQITNYSKPEYPIEWIDRGATGAELITVAANRDFSSDTGFWTKQTNATIPGDGVCHFTATPIAEGIYHGSLIPTLNKIYRIKYEVVGLTSGSFSVNCAGAYGTPRTTTGVFSDNILVTNNSYVQFYAVTNPSTLTFDNVSVVQLGCVLDLNSSGMGRSSVGAISSGKWSDLTNAAESTVSGATLVIPPASNLDATYFNGTSSYVTISAPIFGTGDFSISCWVDVLLIGRVIDGGDNSLAIRVGGGYLQVIFSGVINIYSATVLSDNVWHNITYTRTGGLGRVYVDGINVATVTDTSNYSVATNYIGKSPIYGEYLTGCLSDIKIYKYAISSETAKLLYDQGH